MLLAPTFGSTKPVENFALVPKDITDRVSVQKISPSRLNVFQECPRKYDFVYRQNLQAVGPPKAYFNKGNYFHELSHVYYQMIQAGATPGSDLALASILSRIQNDVNNAPGPELIQVYATISRTMGRFIQEQSPRIDKGITVLGVEHELDYQLSIEGRDFLLFGFIDLLYRDSDGRLRIRDHKTGERIWTRAEANQSNQLMFYAATVYKLTGEVPIAEISYINTHDYKRTQASWENAFAFPTVAYTKRELENYLDGVCHLIDQMVNSLPIPHYGQQCNWCPFVDTLLRSFGRGLTLFM